MKQSYAKAFPAISNNADSKIIHNPNQYPLSAVHTDYHPPRLRSAYLSSSSPSSLILSNKLLMAAAFSGVTNWYFLFLLDAIIFFAII